MRKELPTLILLLLLSPTFVFAQPKQSSQPKVLALTHVTIIDVAARDSRRALKPNQTVVVTGDRITEVGGNVRIPRGAQVIDASGKYLIPGLWDMHVLATATVFQFCMLRPRPCRVFASQYKPCSKRMTRRGRQRCSAYWRKTARLSRRCSRTGPHSGSILNRITQMIRA